MSTLSKLRGSRKPAAAASKPPAESFTEWRSRHLRPTDAVMRAGAAGRLPPAAPCSACGWNPLFWLDAYGKVRCANCSPPPNQSVQRGDLHLLTVGDGYAWLHDRPELTAGESVVDNQPEGTDHPPDVPEEPREFVDPFDLPPSDDSPPCQCGRVAFWWTLDGERRCQKCQPPERKSSKSRLVFSAAKIASELRQRAESSPSTIVWRRKRAERLKAESERDAVA